MMLSSHVLQQGVQTRVRQMTDTSWRRRYDKESLVRELVQTQREQVGRFEETRNYHFHTCYLLTESFFEALELLLDVSNMWVQVYVLQHARINLCSYK